MKTIVQGKYNSRTAVLLVRYFAVSIGAALLIAVTGCKHTAHGVGQDVEKAGEKIQEKTR